MSFHEGDVVSFKHVKFIYLLLNLVNKHPLSQEWLIVDPDGKIYNIIWHDVDSVNVISQISKIEI